MVYNTDGCSAIPAVAEYRAMTLRNGVETCMDYVANYEISFQDLECNQQSDQARDYLLRSGAE
jgi:hypothetical protein